MNTIQVAVALITSALTHLEEDESGAVPMEKRQAHIDEVLPLMKDLAPREIGELIFTLGSISSQTLRMLEHADPGLVPSEMLQSIALRSEGLS